MANFTFTDRLSWVAWRADWRARYAEASQLIRAAKREAAELHVARRGESEAGRRPIDYRISSIQENLPYLRRAANTLMIERTEATAHKNEMLAEREQLAA